MIAMWMLYAISLAVLFGSAAWLVDRSLVHLGRPTRWVWVAALVGSLVVPAALRFQPIVVPAESSVPLPEFTEVVFDVTEAVLPPVHPAGPTLLERVVVIDPALGMVWFACSLLTACVLCVSHWRLRREVARWPSAEIDGQAVRVSPDVGPAVVGAWRGIVVVPAWVSDIDPSQRRMILRHELEHVAAGDARLLALAALAVVACPWNLGVWWLRSRLRDAIELDCDGRLVRTGTDWGRYAALLLDVAGRQGGIPLAAVGLTPPRSLLSRRIAMLVTSRTRLPYARAVLGVAAGALLVVAACEVPPPTGPRPEAVVSRTSALSAMPVVDRGPAVVYPELLRDAGIDGRVVVSFVVTKDGKADPRSIRIVSTTHTAFESVAIDGIKGSRYRPAMADSQPVAARVQQEILFDSGDGADHPRGVPVPSGFLAPISVVVKTFGRGPNPARRPEGVETRSLDTTQMYQTGYVTRWPQRPPADSGRQGGFTFTTSEGEALISEVRKLDGVPVYPRLLIDAGIEGQVEVGLVVDPATRRTDLSKTVVISKTNAAFERSVLRWLSEVRFSPAIFDVAGSPARGRTTVTFSFIRRAGRESSVKVKVGTYWTPVKD